MILNSAKNRLLKLLLTALFTLFSLSGCVSLFNSSGSLGDKSDVINDSASEAVSDQNQDSEEHNNTALELALDPDLPKQDLSQELLEQLLLLNLASYQGDWKQASESAFQAAEQSQDYRVARIATLLALRNNDYPMAVDSAELWLDLKPDADDCCAS